MPASGPNKGKQLPNGPATICDVESPTHKLFVNLTEGELGRQHGWAGPGPPERRIVAERARVCAAPGSLCPPIGWTMSNRLAEWAPAIFKYYYDSATPADSFLLGPSGYGYVYPSMMDETDKGTLADATADAGKRFDMKGYIYALGMYPRPVPRVAVHRRFRLCDGTITHLLRCHFMP